MHIRSVAITEAFWSRSEGAMRALRLNDKTETTRKGKLVICKILPGHLLQILSF